jgi:hypothetical protein
MFNNKELDSERFADLRVIGRWELKDMVIVDNSVISFAGNLDNGMYVPTFEGDPNDRELLPIISFLKEIHDVDDVRSLVRDFAGIQKLSMSIILRSEVDLIKVCGYTNIYIIIELILKRHILHCIPIT